MRHTTPSDYAAKLYADQVADLSDAGMAAAFAWCVRPARPAEYPAIRDAYLTEYGEPSAPSLFEVTA